MRRVTIAIAIAVIVGGLIVFGLTTDFLVDWAWFSAVGYLQVYWTRLISKTFLFLVTFVSSAVLLGLNGLVAYRLARAPRGLGWVDRAGAFGRVQTLPELWELT